MNPPCGLTREDLIALPILVGPGGICAAFHAYKTAVDDQGKRLICGESLGSHLRAPQPGMNILRLLRLIVSILRSNHWSG